MVTLSRQAPANLFASHITLAHVPRFVSTEASMFAGSVQDLTGRQSVRLLKRSRRQTQILLRVRVTLLRSHLSLILPKIIGVALLPRTTALLCARVSLQLAVSSGVLSRPNTSVSGASAAMLSGSVLN